MNTSNLFIVPNFNKNTQTTWIVDKLHRDPFTGFSYDTVKLEWVFSIIDNEKVYPISLYIASNADKRKERCVEESYSRSFCGTTFTSWRKEYAGKGFSPNQCLQDVWLKEIYNMFSITRNRKVDEFVKLDSAFCFKAQSSYAHESDGFGRSMCYYIVGYSVGKEFDIPRQ